MQFLTQRSFTHFWFAGTSQQIITVIDPNTGKPVQQVIQTKIDPKTGKPTQVVTTLPAGNNAGAPQVITVVDPKTGKPVQQMVQTVVDPKTGKTVQIPIPTPPGAQIVMVPDPVTGKPVPQMVQTVVDPKTGKQIQVPVSPQGQTTIDPKTGKAVQIPAGGQVITVTDPVTGQPVQQIVQTVIDPKTGKPTQVTTPLSNFTQSNGNCNQFKLTKDKEKKLSKKDFKTKQKLNENSSKPKAPPRLKKKYLKTHHLKNVDKRKDIPKTAKTVVKNQIGNLLTSKSILPPKANQLLIIIINLGLQQLGSTGLVQEDSISQLYNGRGNSTF